MNERDRMTEETVKKDQVFNGGGSCSYGKYEVVLQMLRYSKKLGRPLHVLDIGAGQGRWSTYMKRYFPNLIDTISAVEPCKEYIIKYELCKKYSAVLQTDLEEFLNTYHEKENRRVWDVIILGDVIEHFPFEKAVVIMEQLKKMGGITFVLFPEGFTQDDSRGPYETHHIVDLTPEQLKELTKGWTRIANYEVSLHKGSPIAGKVHPNCFYQMVYMSDLVYPERDRHLIGAFDTPRIPKTHSFSEDMRRLKSNWRKLSTEDRRS